MPGSCGTPTSDSRGSRARNRIHTAAAESSISAEPTPDAIARPSVKASFVAVSSASRWSAGSVSAACTAADNESRACDSTAGGIPAGTVKPRYTLVTIDPRVAMPSAMPNS